MTTLLATPFGRPIDASVDGFRNDSLFYVTTVMSAVLFVIMTGILVYAAVRHRAGRGRQEAPAARYETGHGRRPLLFTLVITAVIFLGVDGTLLVDSTLDLDHALWKFPDAAQHPLLVEVYAQQWAWNVRYAGADGQFGTPDDVVTLDELHIPVGRPVVVQLQSKDVVHSFYLPNFRLKQDALPDVITRTWFQARRPGRYEIACAQHCGVSHYKMRGLLTVDDPAAFDAWMSAAASDAARRYDATDAEAHWGWPWR